MIGKFLLVIMLHSKGVMKLFWLDTENPWRTVRNSGSHAQIMNERPQNL